MRKSGLNCRSCLAFWFAKDPKPMMVFTEESKGGAKNVMQRSEHVNLCFEVITRERGFVGILDAIGALR